MRTCYEGRGADCWNSVAGLVFLACAAGQRKFLFTWETIIYTHTLMGAQVVLTEQAELVEQKKNLSEKNLVEKKNRLMGAQVVLTEQAELVALLRQNLKANFEDDSAIAAAVFFL